MSESGHEYTPIAGYGLVGDGVSCALVSRDGSIDWFPAPHLESAGVFAAILDADRGGSFSIRPTGSFESSQAYADRTNVLETTFETDTGTLRLTDFMPVDDGSTDTGGSDDRRAIYRKAEATAGAVEIGVEFAPRLDFARAETTVDTIDTADGSLRARADGEALSLSASVEWTVDDGVATARTTLSAGQTAWFVLQYRETEAADAGSVDVGVDADASTNRDGPVDPERRLDDTVEYWREWAHDCGDHDCVFDGQWHDLTTRSGLVLKLLAHDGSGAIAAAPTTSLPEEIGGERNWDYRFSWLRDGAFTIQALSNLGHRAEARAFFEWFQGLCHTDPADLQPLYGLHGETDLTERELDHLSGYCGSTPVRVGNAAREQRQLDVFGELLIAAHETTNGGADLDASEWPALREIIEHAQEVWDEPDEGIWEVRCNPKQFVFSKVMCWAALDRGIEMAASNDLDAPLDDWRACREEIRETVLDRGFDESIGEQGSFTRTLDGDDLDAAGLLLPIVGFLPFDDRRVQGTIDATIEGLTSDDGLVYRYDGEDGLEGEEGAFVLCSFWLVDALTLSGRIEEAHDLFESLISYANPLGLLAEEIDPETGTHLGNFPQAFSHIGLINSALYLGRALGREGAGPELMGFDDAVEAE